MFCTADFILHPHVAVPSSQSPTVFIPYTPSYAISSSLGSPPPQLLPRPLPHLLDRNLRLEHSTHALPPALLQTLHLAPRALLPPPALDIHEVDLALRAGEFALQLRELGLEGVVAEQPGVLAVLVEQLQVREARLEVRGGDGGAGQRRRGEGVVRGFVARRVDGSGGREGRGDAGEFGGEGGCEGGFFGGGEGDGGGGGGFGGDEGVGGGEVGGGGLGVDV